MALSFPLNDLTPHGNISVINMEDSHCCSHKTEADKSYIDEVTYPHLRHALHVNTVRVTASGIIVPVTEYATEAAAVSAGAFFGLIDLSSQNESQVANFIQKASKVIYYLLTPQTLAVGDVYIHHAVDTVTSKLHPTRFLVNSTKTNAIGKLTDFSHIASGVASKYVVGTYAADYWKDGV